MSKKYGRRSTERLVHLLEEAGYGLTNNPHEAIYILDDGRMIDGQFDCGTRGLDHQMIAVAYDDNPYDGDIPFEEWWCRLHRQYRLLRVIPETGQVLIKGKQRITPAQREIITQLNYTVEVY